MNRNKIIAVAQSALVVALGISTLHDAGAMLARTVQPVRAQAATVLASLRGPRNVPVLRASLPAPVVAALPSACSRHAVPAPPHAVSFDTNFAPIPDQVALQRAIERRTQLITAQVTRQITEAQVRTLLAQKQHARIVTVQAPLPPAAPIL